MDIQNTSLFVLILCMVLVLLYKNEKYNSVEQFDNHNNNQMTKAFNFLGNKLVDYKNIKLKNFKFNSNIFDALLNSPNEGPVALANGNINNTGQIHIKLDTKYEISGIIIKGIKKFSIKYYCEITNKFKSVYGPDKENIFMNSDGGEMMIQEFETKAGLSVVTNRINIYNMDKKQSEPVKFQLYGLPIGNTIKKFLKKGFEIPLSVLTNSGIMNTVSNIYKGELITDKIINLSTRGNDNFIVKSLSFKSNINKFKLFYKSSNDSEFRKLDDSLEILGAHHKDELFKYTFKHPIILNKLVLVVLSTVKNSSEYFIKNVNLFVENTERRREIEQKDIDTFRNIEGFESQKDIDDQIIIKELNTTCELLNLQDQNKSEERRSQINNKLIRRIKKQERYMKDLNKSLSNLMDDYNKNTKNDDIKNILMNNKLKNNIEYGLSFNNKNKSAEAIIV